MDVFLLYVCLHREVSLWRSWTRGRWRFSCAVCWRDKATGKVSDGYHSTSTDTQHWRLPRRAFLDTFFSQSTTKTLCLCQSDHIPNLDHVKRLFFIILYSGFKGFYAKTFKSGSRWTVPPVLLLMWVVELYGMLIRLHPADIHYARM